MRWILENAVPIAALTAINMALAGFVLLRLYERARGNWREVIANTPAPALGIASSYGVYAFNERFVPSLVAVVMAFAYETTYIGIAALTDLDDAQSKRGAHIALSAAWISFVQNTIAALFFSMPELDERIAVWTFTGELRLKLAFSALHGAQVWVAYHAARLILQRRGQTITIAKQRDYPLPVPISPNNEEPNNPESDPLPDADRPVDNRYSLVADLRENHGVNGQPLPWREVSKRMLSDYGIKLSYQSCANIYNRGHAVNIGG